MNDVLDALDAWKGQTMARSELLRRLLEYENWMMPMNAGVNSFGPFTLALPKLIADSSGQSRILLFADYDAQEAFAEPYQATGDIGFANPTGWGVFSVARVAQYPGYHLAVVQREEGVALIHVPHDDDQMFVPVFARRFSSRGLTFTTQPCVACSGVKASSSTWARRGSRSCSRRKRSSKVCG